MADSPRGGIRSHRGIAGLVIAIALLCAAPASAAAATKFVDDDSLNTSATCGQTSDTTNATTSACDTIQKGVNAAAASDTVQVAAGEYPEQVTITKAINLVGAGRANTTIDPAFADLADKFDVVGSGANDRRPIVFVNAPGDVNVSALTVDGNDGADPESCGTDFNGITYLETGGTVNSVTVTGIRASDLSGCQIGIAIYNLNGNGDGTNDDAAHSFTVSNSTVTDFQKNGITANDTGLTATIISNQVHNSGDPEPIAQNGIQLGFGAAGSIIGNFVSDLAQCSVDACGPDPVNDTQGAGILTFGNPTGLSITGNTVTATEIGLLHDGGAGTHTASSNTFSGNLVANVYSDDGTLNLQNNQIAGAPYGVIGVGYTSVDIAPIMSVTGNNISDNDFGISSAREDTDSPTPSIAAHFNRIVGNGTGVDNTGADTGGTGGGSTIDGINNWWGCNGGPNSSSCDDVAGTVSFNPWLVLGLSANPATVAPGGSSQLIASLRTNSQNQNLGPGFPNGIPVFFTGSGGTVQPPSSVTGAGQALSSFIAGGSLGTASATATLDNQSVTTPLTIAPAAAGGGTNAQQQAPGACANKVIGDSDANKLKGTSGGDRIKGKGGNDRLRGKGGEDCLSGGTEDDRLNGGSGEDLLKGGAGDDVIKARDGEADKVRCGFGDDRAKVDSLDSVSSCEDVG